MNRQCLRRGPTCDICSTFCFQSLSSKLESSVTSFSTHIVDLRVIISPLIPSAPSHLSAPVHADLVSSAANPVSLHISLQDLITYVTSNIPSPTHVVVIHDLIHQLESSLAETASDICVPDFATPNPLMGDLPLVVFHDDVKKREKSLLEGEESDDEE
ncbi:hypothetical protein L1887_11324 [Cichorium endivia]|nr:hypothetical protein L1887_11324 [Cichorium endivia]